MPVLSSAVTREGGFQTSFLATFRHVLASRDSTNEFLLIQESVKYCMNMHEQRVAPSWFEEHVLRNGAGEHLAVFLLTKLCAKQ